jgi:hypothetical protein
MEPIYKKKSTNKNDISISANEGKTMLIKDMRVVACPLFFFLYILIN